mmetsp:Transcript_19073/g.38538  ORF Transcript_19073/g.38538 Transcript_19073/m.38538 type:complete len:81 (+) Transcript_19073:188-430(+)
MHACMHCCTEQRTPAASIHALLPFFLSYGIEEKAYRSKRGKKYTRKKEMTQQASPLSSIFKSCQDFLRGIAACPSGWLTE